MGATTPTPHSRAKAANYFSGLKPNAPLWFKWPVCIPPLLQFWLALAADMVAIGTFWQLQPPRAGCLEPLQF
jgi:hypothetical protein